MAQQTALSVSALPGPTQSFSPKTAALAWTDVGEFFLYTSANWSNATIYFQATVKADSGTAYARLYDIDAVAAVADSQISTVSATLERVRSSALTLTDGNEYVAQVAAVAGDSGSLTGASLILI